MPSINQWHIEIDKNQAYVHRAGVRLQSKGVEFKNILKAELGNHNGKTCIQVRSSHISYCLIVSKNIRKPLVFSLRTRCLLNQKMYNND